MNLPIRRSYIFISLIIGVLYAFTLFDASFIFGQSAYWTEPYGDCILNMVGARYFAQDNWRWPLYYVPILAFPEGTNIIYTDSLPLLALAAKVVYKMTGEWFNYFGFWLFACFPLLAVFVACATKEGGGNDLVAIIGAVLLALASPALLVRFGHAALMAHFLIAWSLLLYLKFSRTSSLRFSTLQFIIVALLSVMLQMYFLLMVMPFFVAALMQSVRDKRASLRDALFSFTAMIGSVLMLAVILGIIGPGISTAPIAGFGYYSMNVLSPFLPPREHLPNLIAKYAMWSGNTWDATGGQGEGYNYLGAGILLLIVVQIAFSWSLIKRAIKQHAFLFFMLACLLLLALSTRVYIGNWLILNLEHFNFLIKPLIGHFRTSGRFFWPIYYVLTVFLVLLTFKRFSPNIARTVIILAVVIQIIDTQSLRHNMAQAVAAGYPQVLPKKAWTELLSAHQFVKQYPSYQCGGWANNHWPENNSNMELLLLAAKLNKPINSAYLARPFRNCTQEFAEGIYFEIQNEGLYIYSGRNMTRHIEREPDFQKLCREFKYGYVCSRKWELLSQLVPSTEFQEVKETAMLKQVGSSPKGVPLKVFKQEIFSPTQSLALKVNEKVTIKVTVKNIGNELWPIKGSDEKGTNRVNLGFQWLDSTGKVIHEDRGDPLPNAIMPNSSVTLDVNVLAHQKPGDYTLRFSMVQESVVWFYEMGAVPFIVKAKIRR